VKNVYLFQPQYAVDVGTQVNYYLPYSVGCIWSYAQQFDDIKRNYRLADLIFSRELLTSLLDRLDNPAVCGFGCYVWNENYCVTVAQAIKQRWPECIIVFGGPQANSHMTRYEFIDSIILGEGEENFAALLREVLSGKLPDLFYQKRRIEVLDFPSPYTAGVFDAIIAQNPNVVWAMTLETNRGCPYACTFCDWGSVTYSKVKKFDIKRVQQDLEWAVKNPIRYLLCADANMGIYKERDIEIARMVRLVAEQGQLESVNFQYAKNSTDHVFAIARELGDLSRGITVSVQSMNDDTLEAIKRTNLDTNNIKKMMRLSAEHNIPTYTEVILGLPNETLESWKQGFDRILELGQHNLVDMWFAQVLINSEMAQSDYRRQYGIKTIVAKDYMPLYNKNDSREIVETIEIVNQTSSMSTEDMIEAYMYGWMILHFHIGGYTQIIAKYLRQAHNMSYRKFYDQVFEQLPQCPAFGEHYTQTRTVVAHYLNTGEVLPWADIRNGAHALHSNSYLWMFEHKQDIFDFVKDLVPLPDWVGELQQAFIYDQTQTYPLTITANYNIVNEREESITYNITAQPNVNSDFNFYQVRRKGLLKNKIFIGNHDDSRQRTLG
jgi:putative methyltransferase